MNFIVDKSKGTKPLEEAAHSGMRMLRNVKFRLTVCKQTEVVNIAFQS
jgi:hypothetical protein